MITIGTITKEVKARVSQINFSTKTETGIAQIEYFYSYEVEGIEKDVVLYGFSHPITSNPGTTTKINTLLSKAVEENPIP